MEVPGLSVMARMREDAAVQEMEIWVGKKILSYARLRIRPGVWLWGNLSAPPEAPVFLSALWRGAFFLKG